MVQPVMSMLLTAGVRKILTTADFNAGSPYDATIDNIRFLTKLTLSYTYGSAGPHYLILSPDSAATAIAVPTQEPYWVQEVYPNNQSAPASRYPAMPNEILFFQPLACSNLDIYFQSDLYPGTPTLFKPTAVVLSVEYYPAYLV